MQSCKPIDFISCFSLFVELGGCDFHPKGSWHVVDPEKAEWKKYSSYLSKWNGCLCCSAVRSANTAICSLASSLWQGQFMAVCVVIKQGIPPRDSSCPLDSFSCLGFEDYVLKMLKLRQKWTVRLMTRDWLPKMLCILKYSCKMYIFS